MLASLARQDDRLELKRGSLVSVSSTQSPCAERASRFLRCERRAGGGGRRPAACAAANE